MVTKDQALKDFVEQKTVLLTTFKRDGTPVGTPVNVVVRDGRAYFRTWHTAWKAVRLRNNPEVEIAPSTFKGKPTGEAVRGRVRLLSKAEARPIRKMLAGKHPLLQGILVPLGHKLKRVKTLHYEVTLDGPVNL